MDRRVCPENCLTDRKVCPRNAMDRKVCLSSDRAATILVVRTRIINGVVRRAGVSRHSFVSSGLPR
jgi:hypothetical protein